MPVLYKLFNSNTLKLSYIYSCTSKLDNIIKRLNKINLNFEENVRGGNKNLCNCRRINNCPINGACCLEWIVYCASRKWQWQCKKYNGCTEVQFKKRWYNYASSFWILERKFNTKLENYYLTSVKINESRPVVKWSILRKVKRMKIPVDCVRKRIWLF